jgi:hypothetical protein
MITLALTSTLTTFHVNALALDPSRAYVDPPKVVYSMTNGTIGTRFNVTVRCEGVVDMSSWQVKMSFNDTIINVTRWYEPTWDPTYVFHGKTTLPIPGPVDVMYGPGWLGIGCALFPAPSPGGGFTGNGPLCIIGFNITSVPPQGETYSCAFDITGSDTFWIKVGEAVSTLFDTYDNGQYLMIPEFLPFMMLSMLMVATIVAVALAKKSIRKT